MAKSKTKKKKRGIDELWMVLIVAVLIIFISALVKENDLDKEAEAILNGLTNSNEDSLAPDNVVREERLEKISGMSYSELKSSLNVENEFCIYFEDENGNLIEFKEGLRSIGSDVIEINGVPCGR